MESHNVDDDQLRWNLGHVFISDQETFTAYARQFKVAQILIEKVRAARAAGLTVVFVRKGWVCFLFHLGFWVGIVSKYLEVVGEEVDQVSRGRRPVKRSPAKSCP